MPKVLTMFQSSTGLNTEVDQTRIKWDPKKGIVDLAVAVNCDVDDTGRLSRRKGFDQAIVTIESGSLWCDGGPCLFVSGSNLYQLHPDFTYSVIRSDLSPGRMRYAQVNRDVFYCNGYQNGRFNEITGNTTWIGEDYVGPNTSMEVSDPPIGHNVAFYRGRVYVIVGDVAYYSEGLAYSWVNLAENYVQIDGTRIKMWRPVDDGIYVSTEKETRFLAGDPKLNGGFDSRSLFPHPAVEGTDVETAADMFNRQIFGKAAIWTSTAGDAIYMGFNQGITIKKKIKLPHASYGSAVVKEGQYIALLS